jgi:uncharacterized DUF497 family protein
MVTVPMNISYNPDNRAAILKLSGLDLAEAGTVFETPHLTVADDSVGIDAEVLFITIGYLFKRMVVLTWTARANNRHIISIRIANEREVQQYAPRFIE